MDELSAGVVRQWPLLLVLSVIGGGAIVASTGHWRWASFIIGCGVGLSAALRLALPSRLAGLLVVRSRWIDVFVMGGMAAAILGLTLIVPPMRPS